MPLHENPTIAKELGKDWVIDVSKAHADAVALNALFTLPELQTVSLVAPCGNIITSAGDTASVATDLPLPLALDVTPALQEAARAPTRARFVADGLRRLLDWRAFLTILSSVPSTI